MIKEKVYVYHHNDHDGIVAAGVLYNLYPDSQNKEFIFNMIDYAKEINLDHINFENNDEVYFLDYSFTNEHNLNEFKKLLDRRSPSDFQKVTWIDHHKSSFGILDGYTISGILDTSLCGAALTYLYLQPASNEYEVSDIYFHNEPSVPVFLKYIDDYDCWKHMYPVTNDFHYGFTISHPTDAIISNLLYSSNGIDKIIFAGEKIQEYLKFENKEYHVDMYGFEYTLPEEHGGYRCFCLNRKGNSLMFGDKVNEYDAVIPYYFNGDKWRYSMFTIKDNVDCEAVAKSYGGGGHLRAAGWTSDELMFK
jgi:oligoribonuclease NrnB/cAMP/cGMP phosphodiesterase (DHH superfamily)